MTIVPAHFLFRLTYPCHYRRAMPERDRGRLLDLPAACRLDGLAGLSGSSPFADVRLAWNELGLGLQAEVKGKEKEPQGDAERPRSSDGLTLWIDTRDTRTIHRASRHCHQFYFLPTGGGPQRDEPAAGQVKINRATQDAPLCPPEQIPFQASRKKTGYVLEAFLPAALLAGFDPETSPRLGLFYWVRDTELGEQTLGVGADFPFWEDPSLWSTIELVRGS